ncbi:hypothetical protein HU200_062875 [Digitaria exilis]|uniref:Uncharacterized protein n=1 Tax=Digitaria exilis TaxID=1010633 RepID=A0A835A6R6_9POAL|nr:hypothetical protein HU200_062875 [Digitaria exilis]
MAAVVRPLEVHADIGEGISDVPNTVSAQGRRAITFVMNRLETLHVLCCGDLRQVFPDGRPVAVDCEKEWWDNLEWDGMEHGHHPSLFQPCHSKYSKKRNLRGTGRAVTVKNRQCHLFTNGSGGCGGVGGTKGWSNVSFEHPTMFV